MRQAANLLTVVTLIILTITFIFCSYVNDSTDMVAYLLREPLA